MAPRARRPLAAAPAVLAALAVPAVLAMSGCATYSAKVADLRPDLAAGRFDDALRTVEERTGGKDRLLYHLERGLLLHYQDRWQESNADFAAAELLAEDLYTKSISEGALSLLTNDTAISYRARPFELAMVPYYKALNYLLLDQMQDAQVEARRAGLLMSEYVQATLGALREEDRDDFARSERDPFLLYWSGLVFEGGAQVNDAFVAYRNAAHAYQDLCGLLQVEIPPWLGTDLQRTASRLGLQGELDALRADCPDVFAAADTAPAEPAAAAACGEVVFLLESGFVPQKAQVRFDFPVLAGADDRDAWAWQVAGHAGDPHALAAGRKIEYWVSVAAPELQDAATGPVAGCRLDAGTAGGHASARLCANLARRARITFDAEKAGILFKTVLRGMTKYLAAHQAKQAGGEVVGALANLFGAATESADTRSWLTLPREVWIARLSLPPGTYDLRVDLLDAQGLPSGSQTIAGVQVRSGRWTYLSRRVF